ncbi:MAG: prepilin-type N-terminal cleavage/methylation domain-containing protein [Acidobacteriota bacterium]|jgi:type IV pilus assembly protein PilW
MTTPRNRERGIRFDAAGYSLIELLVAMLVSTLVVGGVMTMLTSIEEVHRDSQQLIDAQQQARISMEQIQRDLQVAGVGLAWLVAPLPLIVPQGAGSFQIRHNQGGLTSALAADQTGTGGSLTVNDVTGFAVGMTAGVYDSSGAFDLVTITGIDTGNNRISHTGTSKAFTVADGTAVAHIETITYAVDAQNRLTRQIDNNAAQPIAGNVVNFAITYWNNGDPTTMFNPATNAEMMRIQTVQIDLTIETEDAQINTANERQVTLSTRVTPRAIVLS